MSPTKPTKRKAADIMVSDVVTTTPESSVREALDLMSEHHVSGLPVLNSKDRCVGVISASDVMSLEMEHVEDDTESLGSYFDPDTQRWENVRVAADDEKLADVSVSEIMARELVSLGPDASVGTVARTMLENNVHRVLVLGEDQGLHGIISAFDLVQIVADELA